MQKPSFSKINQYVFSASLALLSGLAVRYLNALQGYCTSYNIPCDFLVVIIATILFFVFNAILEILWNFFDKRKNSLKDKTFIIRMTKPQFERSLDDFVNKPNKSVLIPPRIMINWRELRNKNTNWDDVKRKNIDDIRDADSVKLLLDPFRGLKLELTESNAVLLVSVNPEGDKEPITVTKRKRKHLVFQHTGYKSIPVNQKAYNDLLLWLNLLEKKGKMEHE